MTPCYDTGALRAYLDGELPADETSTADAHLDGCVECRARLDDLRALDERVSRAIAAVPDNAPGGDAAFARLRVRLPEAPAPGVAPAPLARLAHAVRTRRPLAGGAVAAALLLVVLLVPGARAAATSLLQVFRAQNVVYISVSPNRVQQLQNLNVDASALFISKPKQIGAAPSIKQVSTRQAAAGLATFTPGDLTVFPTAPTATTYSVMGASAYQLQVNVKTLRQVLSELGVTDVTIPDALGAKPITISLPTVVETVYTGAGYSATLIQGSAPTVDLPAGVDLTQLGKAVLEVYGMSPDQAGALSQKIDWRSTLVFPFPTGIAQIQQVSVGGGQGVLLDAGNGCGGQSITDVGSTCASQSANGQSANGQSANTQRPTHSLVVYWQKGSRFYVLQVQGTAVGDTAVLEMADSLR
jgi:hypothetical protein